MKVLNTLVRCCVSISDFEDTVLFYENLMNQMARLRFNYPENRLQLAQVASILIIGGDDESLSPHIATNATYYVEGIDEYWKHLPKMGVEIIEDLKQVSSGYKMLVKHPDGTLVEYVEHNRKHKDDILPLSK